jgi:hypothetical protein
MPMRCGSCDRIVGVQLDDGSIFMVAMVVPEPGKSFCSHCHEQLPGTPEEKAGGSSL